MSDTGCTVCYARDHVARDCRRVACNFCQQLGHLKRDCPEYRRVRTVRVYFEHSLNVRAAITPTSNRSQTELFEFLRTLPEMNRTVKSNHVFSSNGNTLLIEYTGRSEIQVSLQNGLQVNETLIQIGTSRVKISSKYSILSHELYEDNDRDGMGSHRQDARIVPVNVLLVAEQMFQSTVCIEVNNSKYYVEWRRMNALNRPWSVVVQTDYMYRFRRGPPAPRLIENLSEYFLGPINEPVAPIPPVDRQQPNENDAPEMGEPAIRDEDRPQPNGNENEGQEIAEPVVQEAIEQEIAGPAMPEINEPQPNDDIEREIVEPVVAADESPKENVNEIFVNAEEMENAINEDDQGDESDDSDSEDDRLINDMLINP